MSMVPHFSLFALGFSSLFPLINPIGTALIVNRYFAGVTSVQRRKYSLSVCVSCFALGVATLFLGSWCLKFMGISIPVTQMAGGIIIARMGLNLLGAGQAAHDEPPSGQSVESSVFYPISFPLTLGPGGISVLITLSAHAHAASLELTFARMTVFAGSLLAVLVVTYICFVYSEFVIRRIGPSGSLVLNRLMAFIVFCIGIQMLVTGWRNLP